MSFTLHEIEKSYDGLRVLAGISMTVGPEEIVAVLGPSGCGKTTLLSIIAGLIPGDAGWIKGLNGERIGMVFQEPRLLDWLTVAQNIDFVLADQVPVPERTKIVDLYLARMGLEAYRDAYPRRLSGGQRQRVAIARALAYPARIMLLDEPFKSLDIALKMALLRDLWREWTATPRSAVLVTHDVKEALLIADRVIILSAKPTVVLDEIKVDLHQSDRRLDDPALLEMERKILKRILPPALEIAH